MSNTDSFIEEVTEEVRRDRLFALMRRYGWIAVVLVIAIVGAAAANEVRKNNARADAQKSGDAILAAVSASDTESRVAALNDLKTDSAEAQIVSDMLLAAHQVELGEGAHAAATLEGISTSALDMPEIYRQIAAFKGVLAQGQDTPVEERRLALETLAAPGAPLSLLAREQLALISLEEGDAEGALSQLQELIQDAEVTAGLRNRATQLIVALGGTPAPSNGLVVGQ